MAKLIGKSGQPLLGLIPGGVEEVNYLDFDFRSSMDRPLGPWRKKWRFNQFEFVSLLSPELILGAAIVDLGLVGNAFVYVYEPASGRYEEFSFLQPLARHTSIDTSPAGGSASFRSGRNRIEIEGDQLTATRRISISLASGLSLDAELNEGLIDSPLAICTRAGYDGWVYTHKAAGLPARGRLEWGDRVIDLEKAEVLGSIDWTAGYMRRETFWNWGSLSAYLPDGRRVGFNLAAGVNETGFTENAVWLDGRMTKIDMVDFRFDRYAGGNWSMRSADGVVDLQFEPQGKRCEKVNAIVIASNFTQYFGRYRGRLVLGEETIELDGLWGLAEDHYAKW